MRTEVWRNCRNVKGGWRCTTEHGEDLFIAYPADYAERYATGPARVPEPGQSCSVRRFPDGRAAPADAGEPIEVIIERARGKRCAVQPPRNSALPTR